MLILWQGAPNGSMLDRGPSDVRHDDPIGTDNVVNSMHQNHLIYPWPIWAMVVMAGLMGSSRSGGGCEVRGIASGEVLQA
jgi:hypothetical protein